MPARIPKFVIDMVVIIPEFIVRECLDLEWRDHGRLGKYYGKFLEGFWN